MAEKVWTAEEFERLSPVQQDAVFEQSIVTDLAAVPEDFLTHVRERVQQRIDTEASSQP